MLLLLDVTKNRRVLTQPLISALAFV